MGHFIKAIIWIGMLTIEQTALAKTSSATTTMTYTTRPSPTLSPEKELEQWMSPSHAEHESKYIESVIYEPQPKVVLSRSTYKITSFIEFAPYIDSFKRFERFLNRFTKELDSPDFVGPLYNVNRTKSESWNGPKSDYFRVQCRKNAYRCRLVKQFKLLRSQVKKIKILFREIYTRFIRAIDSMDNHPTSNRRKGSKGTRLKRETKIIRDPLYQQISQLDSDDEIMLRNGRIILEQRLAGTIPSLVRRKRFIVASAILGWRIHKNKQEIDRIKGHLHTLYEQNTLQQDQIFELAHILNTTYGYVAENRLSIYELNTHLIRVNKTLMGVLSEIKFIKFSIAIITDVRSTVSRLMLGLITLRQNVDGVYEFIRVLATYRVNSVMISPYSLRHLLDQVKEDMKRNPRLRLPEDPEENITPITHSCA